MAKSERTYTIKIREAGAGYNKGEVVQAVFHGCCVIKGEEQATLTFQDGPMKGDKVVIPFRVFKFHEAQEVPNADQT
jgi:hypothetical protein